jgi:hypothetical protein
MYKDIKMNSDYREKPMFPVFHPYTNSVFRTLVTTVSKGFDEVSKEFDEYKVAINEKLDLLTEELANLKLSIVDLQENEDKKKILPIPDQTPNEDSFVTLDSDDEDDDDF